MEDRLLQRGINNKKSNGLYRFCYRIAFENDNSGFETIVIVGREDLNEQCGKWQESIASKYATVLNPGYKETSVYRKTIVDFSKIHSEFSDEVKKDIENELDVFITEIQDFENSILQII